MLDGLNQIYRSSRFDRGVVLKKAVFIIFLSIPLFNVYGEVRDNASWMQEVLKENIELPDSLLSDSGICIKEVVSHSLNSIVRQAIIERFSKDNSLSVYTNNDSVNTCCYTLEYQITTMKVVFSPLKHWLFKPGKFYRTAIFEVKLNLISSKNSNLLWTKTSTGRQRQELRYADIQKTNTAIYPDLNASLTPRIMPTIIDAIILLGSAGGLIYFLYK